MVKMRARNFDVLRYELEDCLELSHFLRDALHGESGQLVIEKKHTRLVARQRFASENINERERESSQIHVGCLTRIRPNFWVFQENVQFLGLIRSLPSQSSDKSGVMGIIVPNHSAFRKRNRFGCSGQIKKDSSAILSAGIAFVMEINPPTYLPQDRRRNIRLKSHSPTT